MMTWGVKPNTNVQQVQSLGAVATGVTHTFTRFRTGGNGSSLHPLQRTGQVGSASSGLMGARLSAPGGDGFGGAPPAAWTNMALPPVVPIAQARFQVA